MTCIKSFEFRNQNLTTLLFSPPCLAAPLMLCHSTVVCLHTLLHLIRCFLLGLFLGINNSELTFPQHWSIANLQWYSSPVLKALMPYDDKALTAELCPALLIPHSLLPLAWAWGDLLELGELEVLLNYHCGSFWPHTCCPIASRSELYQFT